nr:olfactory receptor class A-like protein 1 [Nerophis lumbriciformis]
MDLCVTIKGVSFLLQTGMGILGNTVVLLAYAHIIFTKSKLLPVDMILCHLAFANLVLLLTRGVPQTMTVFGRTNLLNDPGCKCVPGGDRRPRWATLVKIEVCTSLPGLPHLCRTLVTQLGHILSNFFSCYGSTQWDFFFVALMVASSGYILLLLHRHSRQVRAMRRSQGSGVESRAVKTVVTLVVLYVFFFGIDNVIWIYMLTEAKVSPVVTDMKVFFSSCFAFLSPYFIISSNKKVKAKVLCAAELDRPPSMDTQESRDKGLSLS